MNTIKLPVRFGRFLARKLDPRRRESLEDSLRIGSSRLEERQQRILDRAADREQQAASLSPAERAYQAEQAKGRRRIGGMLDGLGEVFQLGDGMFRLASLIVRGLLRVITEILEGLSTL